VLGEFKRQMHEIEHKDRQVNIVVWHSSDMVAVRAWASAGFPADFHLDPKLLTRKVTNTQVDLLRYDPNTDKWTYSPNYKLGTGPLPPHTIWLIHHASTEFNTRR
jgi:hypothetical protein